MDQREDRSLGELFADLTREMAMLIRQEFALATAEMSQKATRVGTHLAFVLAGAALAYAGLIVLLGGIAVGLAWLMPLWLSALLTGLVVAGVGGALVYLGLRALRNVDLTPRETLESVKETTEWAKQQVG